MMTGRCCSSCPTLSVGAGGEVVQARSAILGWVGTEPARTLDPAYLVGVVLVVMADGPKAFAFLEHNGLIGTRTEGSEHREPVCTELGHVLNVTTVIPTVINDGGLREGCDDLPGDVQLEDGPATRPSSVCVVNPNCLPTNHYGAPIVKVPPNWSPLGGVTRRQTHY